jgi:hypothetical protein
MQKSNYNSKSSEILRNIYEKVGKEMNLPTNVVEEIYNSQFKFSKEVIQDTWDKFKLKGKYNYNFEVEFPVLQIVGLCKLIPSNKRYKAAYSKMQQRLEEEAKLTETNNIEENGTNS